MEHETGPGGPDGTEEAGRAAATQPSEPESVLAPREVERGAEAQPSAQESVLGPRDAERAAATQPDAQESVLGSREAEQAGPTQPNGPERAPASGPATGEPRVDAALSLLDRLPDLPVSEHAELYEHVHGQLSDVLGELDSGSAGSAGD